jgi:membrane protease YdiL (CAAX protease family)
MQNSQPPPPALILIMGIYLTAIFAAWCWALIRLRSGRPLLEDTSDGTRQVPWGVGSVVGLVLIYLGVSKGIVSLVDPWIRGGHAVPISKANSESEAFSLEQMLLVALINVTMIIVVPVLLALTSGARRYHFGLAGGLRRFGKDCLTGAIACLVVSPIVYGIQILAVTVWKRNAHPMEMMIRDDHSWPVVVLAFLSGVVLAPIAEELFFRGVLMGWLTKVWARTDSARPNTLVPEHVEIGSPGLDEPEFEIRPVEQPDEFANGVAPRPSRSYVRVMPNVMTSLVFAGIHADQWPAPVAIFVLSLALGALYQRTGRLLAPIALHATFNGVSTLMVFIAIR